MTLSQRIQFLLTQFPALKPLGIERLLAEHGFKVDSNLIVVARHRGRRKRSSERQVFEVFTHLLKRRADLTDRVVAEFDSLLGAVLQVQTASPDLAPEQVADRLAAQMDARPPQESSAARMSHVFLRVLEQNPQYRRSMELASGMKDGGLIAVIPFGVGLDAATDERLGEMFLDYLRRTYPPGTTVEEIARAYLEMGKRRAEGEASDSQAREIWGEDRARRISTLVAKGIRGEDVNADAVVRLAALLLDTLSDWTDEAIADRMLSSLELGIEREPQPENETEGLTVRDRP